LPVGLELGGQPRLQHGQIAPCRPGLSLQNVDVVRDLGDDAALFEAALVAGDDLPLVHHLDLEGRRANQQGSSHEPARHAVGAGLEPDERGFVDLDLNQAGTGTVA
jgi:hypothetical protein